VVGAVPELASQWVELAELSDERQHALGTKKCIGSKNESDRGRQLKFTPEQILQIKNLVERGKSREEIAESIGVTVGSLQVTCSRSGPPQSVRRSQTQNA